MAKTTKPRKFLPAKVSCFKVVKKVLGDGHCILGCFAEHFNEDISLIIRRLKIEITRDIAYYADYSTLDAQEILLELEKINK